MPENAPILVCFAVSTEAKPFRRLARNLSGVSILVTGMGQKRASTSIKASLTRFRPHLVLSSGFAGGLDPDLPAGTVVFEGSEQPAVERALQAAGARRVRFHCSDRVASTASSKAEIRRSSGAEAVEMESAHIRQACREVGVASLTVRVISDAAKEDLPLDFNKFMTSDQRMNFPRLMLELIKCPRTVPRLLRFQGQINHAAHVLAQALAAAIRAAGT